MMATKTYKDRLSKVDHTVYNTKVTINLCRYPTFAGPYISSAKFYNGGFVKDVTNRGGAVGMGNNQGEEFGPKLLSFRCQKVRD